MEKSKKISLEDISQEVASLRSFVIGLAGKDSEGDYNPKFAKRIYDAEKSSIAGRFTNASDFITRLQQNS